MRRDVRLGNLFNVRDLGGYRTRQGTAVRWNRIYRAASLHQLDPEHEDDWKRLGLATVVDLRRERERKAGGWPSLLGSARAFELPMVPDEWILDPAAYPTATAHLIAAYGDMSRLGAGAVHATFELLADPASYPLLFFCVAGKDRTGLLAALLLIALGVDDEQVLDDYELSGTRVVALVEHLRERGSLDDNPMLNQPLEALRAPRVALESALARIRDEHGSVERYLASCGIDAGVIAAVRTNLLV